MRSGVKGRSRVIDIFLIAALAASGSLPAFATETHQFDVPSEDAPVAIRDFASQAHVQILVAGENVKDKQLHAVTGEFSTDQGLRLLLADSGLAPQYVGDRSIAIVAANSNSTPPATGVGSADNGDKKDSFRLAQASQGVAQSSSTVGGDVQGASRNSENSLQLTEILVTAQKREERLQDVPVSITVLNPETLAQNGQYRLQDYFATVPGLSLNGNAYYGGTQYLTIRGLSTGNVGNPTVAVVIDDVPTGGSTGLSFGHLTPSDIDPSDLERIEVLKGPQGTLYGADSLGGIVKYVTKDPSTSAFSGRVEVNGADVPDGGQGYGVRGAVNIPVSDEFAVRVSGLARRDPGYINDATTGQKNINSADVYGGHIAALFKPSDDLSLKLSALIQKTEGNGSPFVDSYSSGQPALGDLVQTALPGSTPYTTEDQLYSATLKARVVGLDLVSVTAYGVNKLQNRIDDTGIAEVFSGVPSETEEQNYHTDKFSQEIRLSSSVGHQLDWLVGGFYTHENSAGSYQNTYAANIATGATGAALFLATYSPLNLSEYAVFGDLTAHFTDRFDVQLGGRESWNTINYAFTFVGPSALAFYGANPDVGPLEHSSGNAFTYLVTPEFKISPDLMVYGRVASGYRIGGPNLVTGAGLAAGIPSRYNPDKTTNYELGIKGSFFEHRLTFDAAAYYIDWKNFQISESTPSFISYEGNAGGAKSEGLEASIQARPTTGLTITAQGSFDNAVLTQNMPLAVVAGGTYGLAGDRLPYSIRWSGGISVNQDIVLSNEWTGFVGGDLTYIGSRLGEFANSGLEGGQRLAFPGYATFNLRTGARYDSWLINLYLNNVDDKRGITGILKNFALGSTTAGAPYGPGTTAGYYTTIIQPRTVGLSVAKNF